MSTPATVTAIGNGKNDMFLVSLAEDGGHAYPRFGAVPQRGT